MIATDRARAARSHPGAPAPSDPWWTPGPGGTSTSAQVATVAVCCRIGFVRVHEIRAPLTGTLPDELVEWWDAEDLRYRVAVPVARTDRQREYARRATSMNSGAGTLPPRRLRRFLLDPEPGAILTGARQLACYGTERPTPAQWAEVQRLIG